MAVAGHSRGGPPTTFVLRATVSVVSGMTAQAVAAVQGHAVRSLLTTSNAPGPADHAETETSDGAAALSDEIS
jgi:hypothetical protein